MFQSLVRRLSRALFRPRHVDAYVAGAIAFTALTVGAADLLQGASWLATFVPVGLIFGATAAPVLIVAYREGA